MQDDKTNTTDCPAIIGPVMLAIMPPFWNSQTRHNFVGEIRIFSVKIYQSICFIDVSIHVSRKRSRDSYRDAVCKKSATLCNKNRQPAAKNQNRSFTSRGATVGLGLGPKPLTD